MVISSYNNAVQEKWRAAEFLRWQNLLTSPTDAHADRYRPRLEAGLDGRAVMIRMDAVGDSPPSRVALAGGERPGENHTEPHNGAHTHPPPVGCHARPARRRR
jgi:hypothetical protein